MKPKFTELTDGEQSEIIEGQHIRRETMREHMQRMVEYATGWRSKELLSEVLDETPADKEELE